MCMVFFNLLVQTRFMNGCKELDEQRREHKRKARQAVRTRPRSTAACTSRSQASQPLTCRHSPLFPNDQEACEIQNFSPCVLVRPSLSAISSFQLSRHSVWVIFRQSVCNACGAMDADKCPMSKTSSCDDEVATACLTCCKGAPHDRKLKEEVN